MKIFTLDSSSINKQLINNYIVINQLNPVERIEIQKPNYTDSVFVYYYPNCHIDFGIIHEQLQKVFELIPNINTINLTYQSYYLPNLSYKVKTFDKDNYEVVFLLDYPIISIYYDNKKVCLSEKECIYSGSMLKADLSVQLNKSFRGMVVRDAIHLGFQKSTNTSTVQNIINRVKVTEVTINNAEYGYLIASTLACSNCHYHTKHHEYRDDDWESDIAADYDYIITCAVNPNNKSKISIGCRDFRVKK
jgi:hypothetical protein